MLSPSSAGSTASRISVSGSTAFNPALKISSMVCLKFTQYQLHDIIPSLGARSLGLDKTRQRGIQIPSHWVWDEDRDIHIIKHGQVIDAIANADSQIPFSLVPVKYITNYLYSLTFILVYANHMMESAAFRDLYSPFHGEALQRMDVVLGTYYKRLRIFTSLRKFCASGRKTRN